MAEVTAGYLKIANEADRTTVAAILFNNGYTVKKGRRKKNNKSYEYFVVYEPANIDDTPGGEAVEG